MAARNSSAKLEVSLSVSSLMLIIAWLFFIVGIVLLLPIQFSLLGLTPTICFLAAIAAKMLS